MKTVFKICFLGAGNLATHLSKALKSLGHTILQVYSRTEMAANELAFALQAEPITDVSRLSPEADVYICSLKDAALVDQLARVPHFGKALWLHTSGSLPMSVFEPYTQRCGVFYPLQTFSKQRPVDFAHIPFCLEAKQDADLCLMRELALQLSDDVREMSSEQRQNLHVAAVFACNFTNSLYAAAQEILTYDNIDFSILRPLIMETAAKVLDNDPAAVQTGPAVRMDRNVTDKHMAWLEARGEKEKAALYETMSQMIYERSKKQ